MEKDGLLYVSLNKSKNKKEMYCSLEMGRMEIFVNKGDAKQIGTLHLDEYSLDELTDREWNDTFEFTLSHNSLDKKYIFSAKNKEDFKVWTGAVTIMSGSKEQRRRRMPMHQRNLSRNRFIHMRTDTTAVLADLTSLIDKTKKLEIVGDKQGATDKKKEEVKGEVDAKENVPREAEAKPVTEAVTLATLPKKGYESKNPLKSLKTSRSCSIADITEGALEGEFEREVSGGKKSKIFIMIENNKMKYRKEDGAVGNLSLEQCWLGKTPKSKRTQYCFVVEHPKQLFILFAKNENERTMWVKAFSMCTKQFVKGKKVDVDVSLQEEIMKALIADESEIQGFLSKAEGIFGRFREYFFIIRGNEMSYSESFQSIQPAGIIDLNKHSITRHKEKSGKYQFTLTNSETSKSLTLQAINKEEFDKWIRAIQHYKTIARNEKSTKRDKRTLERAHTSVYKLDKLSAAPSKEPHASKSQKTEEKKKDETPEDLAGSVRFGNEELIPENKVKYGKEAEQKAEEKEAEKPTKTESNVEHRDPEPKEETETKAESESDSNSESEPEDEISSEAESGDEVLSSPGESEPEISEDELSSEEEYEDEYDNLLEGEEIDVTKEQFEILCRKQLLEMTSERDGKRMPFYFLIEGLTMKAYRTEKSKGALVVIDMKEFALKKGEEGDNMFVLETRNTDLNKKYFFFCPNYDVYETYITVITEISKIRDKLMKFSSWLKISRDVDEPGKVMWITLNYDSISWRNDEESEIEDEVRFETHRLVYAENAGNSRKMASFAMIQQLPVLSIYVFSSPDDDLIMEWVTRIKRESSTF